MALSKGACPDELAMRAGERLAQHLSGLRRMERNLKELSAAVDGLEEPSMIEYKKLLSVAVKPNDYAEAGGHLGTLIEKGAIQLVKSSWLSERAEAGLPIVRRQDAPPESCWEAEEAMRRWQSQCQDGGESYARFLVVLSYAWCTSC